MELARILVIQTMYLLPSGSEDTGKTILLYITHTYMRVLD
jgi:hypothetical protein